MKKLKLLDKNGNVVKEVPSSVMSSPDDLREILDGSGVTTTEKPKWKRTFEQAVCFSSVSSALYHEHLKKEIININVKYLAPFIVNATFAMELYLKAIHQKLDTKAFPEVSDKHSLKRLFCSLPGKTQNDLSKSLQACLVAQGSTISINLEEKLCAIANGYVDWRYSHEKNYLQIKGIGDLIPLLSALYNSAIDLKWYEKQA